MKKDIQPVTGGYDRVMNYSPVTFKWVDTSTDQATHEGFVAQDVELVNPDAVVYNGGIACIDPVAIIADLVSAMQELNAQLQSLKAKVEGA